MQLKLPLLVLLVLTGLTVNAQTPDTLCVDATGVASPVFPQRIMDLPQTVSTGGDRAGVWGLPTLIALRYGLTVDATRDDRLVDTLAEQAALRYLSDLYAEFGDWDLCYYAYLYSPAYVRNLQERHLSVPQPLPIARRPAPAQVVENPREPQYIVYTVKSGDTLGAIAQRHHVKVSDIKRWNNLHNDMIRVNQQLKIYQ